MFAPQATPRGSPATPPLLSTTLQGSAAAVLWMQVSH